MTVKSKPKTRREKFREWKRGKVSPVEMTRSTINKFNDLSKLLKRDMKDLGIEQVAITIDPKKSKDVVTSHIIQLRIKGKQKEQIPVHIQFNYRLVENLNMQELRHVAWHEFGHFIFKYYYPEMSRRYSREVGKYMVEETFADEFGYRRFGKDYIKTSDKVFKLGKANEEDRKNYKGFWKEMTAYIEDNGYGYWKSVAKAYNVPIKYNPKNTIIVGVKPKAGILGNLR